MIPLEPPSLLGDKAENSPNRPDSSSLKPVHADFPAPLRPSELDPLGRQAAEALYREGESANTVASYRSALRYWAGWFALRYGQPIALPLLPSVIIQFVVDHATRTTPQGPVSE